MTSEEIVEELKKELRFATHGSYTKRIVKEADTLIEQQKAKIAGLEYSNWENTKKVAAQNAEILAQLGEVQLERNNLKLQVEQQQKEIGELKKDKERLDWLFNTPLRIVIFGNARLLVG